MHTSGSWNWRTRLVRSSKGTSRSSPISWFSISAMDVAIVEGRFPLSRATRLRGDGVGQNRVGRRIECDEGDPRPPAPAPREGKRFPTFRPEQKGDGESMPTRKVACTRRAWLARSTSHVSTDVARSELSRDHPSTHSALRVTFQCAPVPTTRSQGRRRCRWPTRGTISGARRLALRCGGRWMSWRSTKETPRTASSARSGDSAFIINTPHSTATHAPYPVQVVALPIGAWSALNLNVLSSKGFCLPALLWDAPVRPRTLRRQHRQCYRSVTGLTPSHPRTLAAC